jgi:hypothetical protein
LNFLGWVTVADSVNFRGRSEARVRKAKTAFSRYHMPMVKQQMNGQLMMELPPPNQFTREFNFL